MARQTSMARQTVLANCSVASSLSWMLNATFWHYAFAGNGGSSEDEDGCDEFADGDVNRMTAPVAVSSLQVYPVDGSAAVHAEDYTTVFLPVHQFGTNTLFGDVLGEGY